MAKKKKEVDDRFKKFGIVSFTGITKVNDFVSYLEQGKVMGTQCNGCGKRYFPPRADCFHCLDSDMEWFEVSGSGKLITYSQLQYAPLGFESDLPYCIALLDYGEYKVFGRISKDIAVENLQLGMEMKAEVIKHPNGQLSYQFVKV